MPRCACMAPVCMHACVSVWVSGWLRRRKRGGRRARSEKETKETKEKYVRTSGSVLGITFVFSFRFFVHAKSHTHIHYYFNFAPRRHITHRPTHSFIQFPALLFLCCPRSRQPKAPPSLCSPMSPFKHIHTHMHLIL